MIIHGTTIDGHSTLKEGDCWIEVGGRENGGQTLLYHTCPAGKNNNVLLVDEVYKRECRFCGPVAIPDGLWTLYAMLDGRGVHA